MSTSEQSLEKRVSNLEAKGSSGARFERVAKGLTVLGALVAFGWGLFQYFDAKEMEFRREFWEKQYALYSRASRAAADIAIAPDLAAAEKERRDFWSLYWGELSIVESKAVHDAMYAYGEKLVEIERASAKPSGLKALSYRLARACRESLKTTWEPVPLDDIPARTKSSD